jgi:hypothetical protein
MAQTLLPEETITILCPVVTLLLLFQILYLVGITDSFNFLNAILFMDGAYLTSVILSVVRQLKCSE